MTRHLFFYGTLMSGGRRSHVIQGLADPIGPATTRGKLFSVNDAFPALIDGDGTVHGEVWRARDEQSLWLALQRTDMIEGYREGDPWSLYRREERPLLCDQCGGTGQARKQRLVGVVLHHTCSTCGGTGNGRLVWTYIWNGNLRGLSPITDGRWRRRAIA